MLTDHNRQGLHAIVNALVDEQFIADLSRAAPSRAAASPTRRGDHA
jgi:hypothetical protein